MKYQKRLDSSTCPSVFVLNEICLVLVKARLCERGKAVPNMTLTLSVSFWSCLVLDSRYALSKSLCNLWLHDFIVIKKANRVRRKTRIKSTTKIKIHSQF